jgi:hypothetical protein
MEHFKLPILSCNNLKKTDETLISELELVKSKSEINPIYKTLFNPQTEQGETIMNEISKYYTNSISFIEDTQELYKIYKPTLNKEVITNFNDSINKIKKDVNFLKEYQYLDIKQLNFLNNHEMFLQLYSIYNISSPVISLIYPIIIFIIPFFLLKLKFKDLPFSAYKNLLIKQLKNSSLGKLTFVIDNEVDAFKKLYVLVTIGLYVYGIYQNIRSCIKFIKNIKHIKEIFDNTQKYFEYIKEEYDRLKKAALSLNSYEHFVNSFETHVNNVKNIRDNILNVNINIKNPTSIGSSLLILHKLNYNKILDEDIKFFDGFVGYIDCYNGLQRNIDSKIIMPVTFTNKETKVKGVYHPSIKSKDVIKNSVDFKKNIILSGPNASGKTTIIKGTCVNILLSQQVGYGYFKSCKLNPYDHINCYLNINDTNDKDSLFQAEARRCKNILDSIKKNNNERHFCIFDELYSGTNPEDAVNAAFKYLSYISNLNCNFIITTHYKELCKKLINSKKIVNKQMIQYKIKKGITESTNGLSILDELNYPKELLNIV